MAVTIYHGKYITAEDATKTIDMPTIIDGCRMLRDASEKLEKLSKKIDLLREIYNRDAISINGSNMEEFTEAYEKNTRDFSLYISDLSDTIQATTQRVINRQQIVLNEEARRLDEKEALLHHDVVSASHQEEVQIDTETHSVDVVSSHAEGSLTATEIANSSEEV